MSNINLHNASFSTSVYSTENLPAEGRPEIIFAGRSNAGKSSMINKLLCRKNLARTGGVPGKTVSINYYDIDGKLWFADLPGYGYAKVSAKEKDRFSNLLEDYFATDRVINMALVLMDIRHKPTADDALMLHFTKSLGLKTVAVLTKADKLSKTAQAQQVELFRSHLFLEDNFPVVPFSSVSGQGVDEIMGMITDLVEK